MTRPRTRREFLADVGRGALAASLGSSLAAEWGFRWAAADEAFSRANPHAIYVAAKHRLRSAVDRVGTDATKTAWKKAEAK